MKKNRKDSQFLKNEEEQKKKKCLDSELKNNEEEQKKRKREDLELREIENIHDVVNCVTKREERCVKNRI